MMELLSNFAFNFSLRRYSLVHGFFGASSMERLPVEAAIADRVREFTDLTLPAPGK